MSTDELAALVERTDGPQPWRRLAHATWGSVIAGALTFGSMEQVTALWVGGAILLVLLALDVVRLRRPSANQAFFRTFRLLASPREAHGVASSTWYTLGALLAVAMFHRDAAVTGILILAWADPAASYLGRRWGSRPFLGGSVEGTLVFVLVAGAVATVRHGLVAGPAAALACALAERRSGPLDDNLALPLVGAGMVTLVSAVLT